MSDAYAQDRDSLDVRYGPPPDPAVLAGCMDDMVALLDRAALGDFLRDDLYGATLRLRAKCETAIFGADQRRALDLVEAIEAESLADDG